MCLAGWGSGCVLQLFVVTNGNYIEGYYLQRANAAAAVRTNGALIAKFNANPNVDKTPCWIETIETVD